MSELLNRRWLRPILLAGIPGVAALVVLLFWLWGGRYISTENAYVKADIAQISAEIAGRVGEMHIRDHAEVKGGDVLVTKLTGDAAKYASSARAGGPPR